VLVVHFIEKLGSPFFDQGWADSAPGNQTPGNIMSTHNMLSITA
jgi:hypothetical protein